MRDRYELRGIGARWGDGWGYFTPEIMRRGVAENLWQARAWARLWILSLDPLAAEARGDTFAVSVTDTRSGELREIVRVGPRGGIAVRKVRTTRTADQPAPPPGR